VPLQYAVFAKLNKPKHFMIGLCLHCFVIFLPYAPSSFLDEAGIRTHVRTFLGS